MEIPDLLDLHRLNPQRYPFLLQSVAHGTALARYDILFAFPQQCVTLNAGEPVDFLAVLDDAWRAARVDVSNTESPFHGGWFLYLGYELAAQIERANGGQWTHGRLPTVHVANT